MFVAFGDLTMKGYYFIQVFLFLFAVDSGEGFLVAIMVGTFMQIFDYMHRSGTFHLCSWDCFLNCKTGMMAIQVQPHRKRNEFILKGNILEHRRV